MCLCALPTLHLATLLAGCASSDGQNVAVTSSSLIYLGTPHPDKSQKSSAAPRCLLCLERLCSSDLQQLHRKFKRSPMGRQNTCHKGGSRRNKGSFGRKTMAWLCPLPPNPCFFKTGIASNFLQPQHAQHGGLSELAQASPWRADCPEHTSLPSCRSRMPRGASQGSLCVMRHRCCCCCCCCRQLNKVTALCAATQTSF